MFVLKLNFVTPVAAECSIKVDYADRALARAIFEDHITQDDALLIFAFIAERKITSTITDGSDPRYGPWL